MKENAIAHNLAIDARENVEGKYEHFFFFAFIAI